MRPALVPILLADPLPWAKKADYAWDFLRDRARFAGGYKGALANTPNWTFTRASTGYAQTSGGALVPFASGELRRTDKGVLIEGAGTNLCLQSQTFGTTWTNTASSESLDAIAAPDGTTTADKLVEDGTAATQHRLLQSVTTTAAAHTFSVYAKAGERSWLYLRFNNSVPENCYAWFNVTTGAVGSVLGTGVTSSIEALGNGWYRCVMKVATAAAASNTHIIGLTTGDAVTDYNGDGASGIYVWGAQIEAAAFPSSYIPTTTASATRAADSLSVPVSGIAYPLSLYAEFERAVDTGTQEDLLYVYATDSTMRAFIYFSSSDFPTGRVDTSGANVANPQIVSTTVPIAAPKRMALRVATNDTQLSYAGGLATADTSCATPTAPRTIVFGASDSGSFPCFGYLRRAALWTRALADGELQSLTT